MKRYLLLCIGLICYQALPAQHLYGIWGSPYGGSLNMLTNPASIVNTPFLWDLTLLAYQQAQSTNAITLNDGTLLHWPDTIHYRFTEGHFSRYALAQADLNVLNARIALDRKRAIGFGLSAHVYGWAHTSPLNVVDTVSTLNSFLNIQQDRNYNGRFSSSGWIDLHATYAQTWIDNTVERLNGGFTLHIMRGISGAYARIEELQVRQRTLPQGNTYLFPQFQASYGYSSNYDQQVASNTYDFLNHSQGSIAVDVGVEYLLKKQEPIKYDAPDPYYDYWWKIGISIVDIGGNRFRYGAQSRTVGQILNNITDSVLQQKFNGVNSLSQFNDSLQTVVSNMRPLNGWFSISNPTRMIVDVDHPMGKHVFLHASLTIPLPIFSNSTTRGIRSNELLLFTPRWETRHWGVYMPLQYTITQKLWIGLALRAGPLLVGVHHLPGLFSSQQATQSGGYIAITIRPSQLTPRKQDKRLNCPRFKF
ncbi:MAG: hypothetical protein K6T34_02270 [Thermoflavifilum sp.]|nr:hypothetical protein [Thermoflavifilum sp.]